MGQAPQSGQGPSFKTQPSRGLKLAVAGVSRTDRNWGMSWLGWSRAWGQEAWWVMSFGVCGSDSHVLPRGSGSGPGVAPQGALVRKEHH